jgi:putative holliday junction resolvase
MKILALDLGDRWVGTALSDPLRISCKPFQTVELTELIGFLKQFLADQSIHTVVVGYPKTFKGGQSIQTEKIVTMKNTLEAEFGTVNGKAITWILWDERLSSKRALEAQQHATTPEAKKRSHSVAAAFILQSYLDNLAFHAVQS